MKWLADEVYPNAEKIIMVCDNLNTHDKVLSMRHFRQQKH